MKACSLVLLLSPAFLCAQDTYTLEWSSISGGAGADSPGTGEYTVQSTLGQITAGNPSSGASGEYSVSNGYWTFTLNEPLSLDLVMQLSSTSVTLTWNDTTGIPIRLENSADLQLWNAVNSQPAHPPFIEPAVVRRFYRIMPVP